MRVFDSASVALEAATLAQTLPPVEIGAHRRRLALERAWLGSVDWPAFPEAPNATRPGLARRPRKRVENPKPRISGPRDLKTPSRGEGERKEMLTRKDPGDRGDEIVSLCRLNQALAVAEECSEEVCPFWEPGGAVLPGRCAFEGLDLAAAATWPGSSADSHRPPHSGVQRRAGRAARGRPARLRRPRRGRPLR
jgi:hypothetical protein